MPAATETVHIVDDDPAIRDSLHVLLEASNFTVRAHDSAAAFLAVAPELRGCVLTDVRMPGIDGLELQRRLNEHDMRLPVIVMTGQGDVPVAGRDEGGRCGFSGKAIEDEALLGAVRRAL
jgi:two-component system, LuxR family, response regulator FixJ